MAQERKSPETLQTYSSAAAYNHSSLGISRPAVQALQKLANGKQDQTNSSAELAAVTPFQLKTRQDDSPTGPRAAQNRMGVEVVQRYGIEDFDTYEEAKEATIYSKALLDEQKDDPINDHFQKKFDSGQQTQIYEANKAYYEVDEIVSDADGETVLKKQNTKLVPHIDHRFPKSRGGTNSYLNAAVLPAEGNIKKSNKLELTEEPTTPLEPYRLLAVSSAFASSKVGTFREFSQEQRAEILSHNKSHYDSTSPVSDVDGKTKLAKYDTTRIPHIDHITAKSEGGTNYYFNASVLPASTNMQKSGRKGRQFDINAEIGEMSLAKYYEKKAEGTLPPGGLIEDDKSDGEISD